MRRQESWVQRVGLGLAVAALFFAAAEGLLRLNGFRYAPPVKVLEVPTVADYIGTYEHYWPTHLTPPGYVWRTEPNTKITDAHGFRRPGVADRKDPAKMRIAFLGGSTTQGGYPAYPERTIRLLNEAAGRQRFEHLNAACSSYSTHQSLLALQRWVLPLKPDVLLVYHGWNDGYLQSDGYSDREKDPLAGDAALAASSALTWLRQWRLTQALGWLVRRLDRTWPRPRVGERAFAENLRHIAEICRREGVPLVLLTRPATRLRPLPALDEMSLTAYERLLGTRDRAAIYTRLHARQNAVIRRIAAAYEHVSLADASAFLDDIQARQRKGAYGDHITIFQRDACHLGDFANQLLAEFLARELSARFAPELEAGISARINSPTYALALAAEFNAALRPWEALYQARKAQTRSTDPEIQARGAALAEEAAANMEFATLFYEGRWGGSAPDFESKIEKLRRCQQLRPTDLGVCLQIFRVCLYVDQLPVAAAAMNLFQPNTLAARYEWLEFVLLSHMAGERHQAAARAAAELLRLNPEHQGARDILDRVRPY
ncbi:MAG: SGNH/GDSL hydrolase family protein [Candidatus Marinimicrobia bacterium]|nr:SGNH/GDSL hydrolase family protein [Candidatus Neomarinimicrobiota bacterium]